MDAVNFDFSLLDLNHSRRGKKIKFVYQCFLCSKMKTTFYCVQCVKNGDFIHSTSRFSERFADKRQRLIQKQCEKDDLSRIFNKELYEPQLIEDKKEELQLCFERIRILKMLLRDTTTRIENRKRTLSDITEYNIQKKQNIKKNKECHGHQKINIEIINKKRSMLIQELNMLEPQLKEVICRRIKELVEFIFPISEIPRSKRDSIEELQNEVIEGGRSKTRIHGNKWVFIDSWRESHHSIIAPMLPDSGDYFRYMHWLAENNESGSLPSTANLEASRNPAYNLIAVFIYATQLVNILAFYLDIRLPNKLNYSDFCDKQLNERKFIKYVTHLNANIIYLCLTQNVDPSLLSPTQTLCNILSLVNSCDLGRQEPVEIPNHYISYFEEQLNTALKETLKLNSAMEAAENKEAVFENDNDQTTSYDSDGLTVEWETLPLVSCPEAMPGSNVSRSNSITGATVAHAVSSNNVTSGLMNSAAAGLASILRGFTYK